MFPLLGGLLLVGLASGLVPMDAIQPEYRDYVVDNDVGSLWHVVVDWMQCTSR